MNWWYNTSEYSEAPDKWVLGDNKWIIFQHMNNATVELLTSFHQTRMTPEELWLTPEQLLIMANSDFFGWHYQITSCPQELKILDWWYFRAPSNFLSDVHSSVKETLNTIDNTDHIEWNFTLSKIDPIMWKFREEDAQVFWWVNNIWELGQKPNQFYRYVHFGVQR